MEPDFVIQLAGQGKDWVDYLTALLTPMIAIVGIGLGFLQWRINRLRLNHELFDKRWKIYIVVTDFIIEHMSSREKRPKMEASSEYLIGIAGCQFVFNNELKECLYQIENIGTASASQLGMTEWEKGNWLSKQLGEVRRASRELSSEP